MSAYFLMWVVLAVSIFWGVGLFNRLMRMRALGLNALRSVEKHASQYGELVSAHVSFPVMSTFGDLDVHADLFQSDWERLMMAVSLLNQALKGVRGIPLATEPISRLAESLNGLQFAWRNLRDTPGDLAGSAVPDAMLRQWDEVTLRVEAARSGFNRILMRYNEAIVQFPARLVVSAMGFRPAGLL